MESLDFEGLRNENSVRVYGCYGVRLKISNVRYAFFGRMVMWCFAAALLVDMDEVWEERKR